jgi:hypothetical protein
MRVTRSRRLSEVGRKGNTKELYEKESIEDHHFINLEHKGRIS